VALSDEFETAQARVKELSSRPSNEALLELYGLFKQGSVGDVQGKRPGMLDMKGRLKYDAWAKLEGVEADEAKRRYIKLVDELAGKDG